MTSNKLEKLLHLVSWFSLLYWTIWRWSRWVRTRWRHT